ncbi:MAG: ABC transporter substrate-binding protein [Candidatus Neomarinimicrobiota bacterium]
MTAGWKFFIGIIVAMLVIGLFWWQAPAPVENDDGKIHLQYWYITGQKESPPYYVEAFNAMQSEIVVEALAIPWQEHEKKILTAVLSGNPPDIVSQFVPVVKWASRMALFPLDTFIVEDNFDPGIFYPALWDEMIYDGHVFGLPIMTVSNAFFINKRMFREAGLDPERQPRTWSEVRELAGHLDQYNDRGQIVRMGFIPDWRQFEANTLQTSMLIAWQLGAEFLSPDGKTVSLNNPAMRTALEWVADYYRQYDMKKVQAFRGSFGYADQHELISEKVAMMVIDSSFPELVQRYNPGLDYAVYPIPSFGDSPTVSTSGSWWLAIPRGARHPRESWQFIKYAVDKDIQLQTCFNTEENLFPTNRLAANDPSFNNTAETAVFVSQMDYAHSPTIIPLAHDVFWREMSGRVQERVLHGLQTAEQSLKEAEKIVQLELDKALVYDEYVRSKMNFPELK